MLILQIMDSINVSQDKGWYIYCVIEKLLAESTTEKCSIFLNFSVPHDDA